MRPSETRSESDPALSHALLPMLQARQMLLETFLELDRRVRRAAHQDAVTTRFMSVPGVGYVTALSFKAAVDDPTRFKSSRTVGAHFGLTPRRFQSGEKDNPGRIPCRRRRRASDALCSRQRDADAVDCLEQPEGMGRAADEDQGTAASHCRCRPQDCRRASSDVDRRHRVPVRIGGICMI